MNVEYIDHMGDDLRIANAARVSFNKESDWIDGDLAERDAKLISYLAKHNHFTPFTHTAITVRETVPIFVARQRFKHTVGFTYNEVSRRYVDEPPEFYFPPMWRKRAEDKKQGSSDEEVKSMDIYSNEGMRPPQRQIGVNQAYRDVIETASWCYRQMIAAGVAPEQARMVLPQSMYTSYYVTGSLAAYARAYKLRSEEHAQAEIQEIAKEWDRVIRPLFPVAWSALVDNQTR